MSQKDRAKTRAILLRVSVREDGIDLAVRIARPSPECGCDGELWGLYRH